jgi:hypothetical protein
VKKLLLSRLLRSPPLPSGVCSVLPAVGQNSRGPGAAFRVPWFAEPFGRSNHVFRVGTWPLRFLMVFPPMCCPAVEFSHGEKPSRKDVVAPALRACANRGTRHRLPCSAVSVPGSRFRIPGSAVVLSPATRLRLRLRRGKPATGYPGAPGLPSSKLPAGPETRRHELVGLGAVGELHSR